MIELGRFNKLKVLKKVDFGLYLDGGQMGEILLPERYVPKQTKIGAELDVFIYLDNEERLVATTETPLAQVGEFAYLKCSWVNQYGAFLNWGLMKDLFCPFSEQKKKMEIGEGYIVYVYVDELSYRIMCSAKIEKFLQKPNEEQLKNGQQVDILVTQKTDLGFKVIIDNKYAGLVYEDQVFRHLTTGDRLDAYINQVRPDGKTDVMLQKTGVEHTSEFSEELLAYLQENGGRCVLGDKSPAEDIYDTFHVSKKVFKKAVGNLYKRRLIQISDEGLTLC